tara:strand:- start:182 stop:715 length:534 start_codon:yes stop_codon:yes gene_type:complete
MRIAITGTPGSGKSTVSKLLNPEYNFLEVEEIAKKFQCYSESQNEKESAIVDVEKLNNCLLDDWAEPPDKVTIIAGHLSHLLPVDAIVILRCNPMVLESRLRDRNWDLQKINSNVECELLGGPWMDLMESEIPPCFELDNTSIELEDLKSNILNWINSKTPSKHSISQIDWIAKLHE